MVLNVVFIFFNFLLNICKSYIIMHKYYILLYSSISIPILTERGYNKKIDKKIKRNTQLLKIYSISISKYVSIL